MKSSKLLLSKIQEFEGCRLTSYKCPAGIWTIGVGHTRGVKPGQTITPSQAITLLEGDLLPIEKTINSLGIDLTQGRFDALVDFCFNCGTGAFLKSTLLRKIRTNPANPAIREEFLKWANGGGKRLPGLVKRREWEADRYFSVE